MVKRIYLSIVDVKSLEHGEVWYKTVTYRVQTKISWTVSLKLCRHTYVLIIFVHFEVVLQRVDSIGPSVFSQLETSLNSILKMLFSMLCNSSWISSLSSDCHPFSLIFIFRNRKMLQWTRLGEDHCHVVFVQKMLHRQAYHDTLSYMISCQTTLLCLCSSFFLKTTWERSIVTSCNFFIFSQMKVKLKR